MKTEIDSIEYNSMLYDFYGALLNEAQRDVMALYHEDNLSLSEIAEELGQSRQAVHYTLKKAENALAEYESRLGLIELYERNQKLAGKAFKMIDNLQINVNDSEKLKSIIKKISE